MRALLAVTLILVLAGCGASATKKHANTPLPLADIDTDAWIADLTAVVPNAAPDVNALYKLTLETCKASVDDLTLRFTLVGANPPETRVDVKYVCPYRKSVVDEAIAKEAQIEQETTVLCNSDPSTMGPDEYNKYDAICQP